MSVGVDNGSAVAVIMNAGNAMAGPVAAPKLRESIVKTNPRLLLERLDTPAMVRQHWNMHVVLAQAVDASTMIRGHCVARRLRTGWSLV